MEWNWSVPELDSSWRNLRQSHLLRPSNDSRDGIGTREGRGTYRVVPALNGGVDLSQDLITALTYWFCTNMWIIKELEGTHRRKKDIFRDGRPFVFAKPPDGFFQFSFLNFWPIAYLSRSPKEMRIQERTSTLAEPPSVCGQKPLGNHVSHLKIEMVRPLQQNLPGIRNRRSRMGSEDFWKRLNTSEWDGLSISSDDSLSIDILRISIVFDVGNGRTMKVRW